MVMKGEISVRRVAIWSEQLVCEVKEETNCKNLLLQGFYQKFRITGPEIVSLSNTTTSSQYAIT